MFANPFAFPAFDLDQSYLCVGGPLHGQWRKPVNGYRLEVAMPTQTGARFDSGPDHPKVWPLPEVRCYELRRLANGRAEWEFQ